MAFLSNEERRNDEVRSCVLGRHLQEHGGRQGVGQGQSELFGTIHIIVSRELKQGGYGRPCPSRQAGSTAVKLCAEACGPWERLLPQPVGTELGVPSKGLSAVQGPRTAVSRRRKASGISAGCDPNNGHFGSLNVQQQVVDGVKSAVHTRPPQQSGRVCFLMQKDAPVYAAEDTRSQDPVRR